MDDCELLREFARTGSEPVFAALVERHIGLVYSAAMRQVGDSQSAEDIAQTVFIVLARKAANLSANTVLSGWLLKTTRYAANAHIRAAVRREQREKQAVMESTLNDFDSTVWKQLAPCLDEAMASLSEADRNAIALRYFENRPWREVAALTHVTEDAAQKRVMRALEKLRTRFGKRGVTLTAALIAGAVSANSVQAAPAGIAKTISVVAATKGVAASASTLTLVKGVLQFMAWSKAKTIVVIGVAAILATGTTTVIVQHQNRPELPPAPLTPQPVTAGETEFPKTSWHFAGYSSPESVFMSCMWAVNNGDANTLLASVSPTEQERLHRGREIITAKDREDYAQMTGYRIVDKQIVSEDQVVLAVETGQDPAAKFLMERINGEWKFAGRAQK
jgi:RNA polymerase sigma factor (sigma-70 family)